MKIYCQQCGAKIEFSANAKPKFCHSCGTSLSLGSDVRANSAVEEEPEEEIDSTTVPRISQLEVDVLSGETPKQTLGDIVGTAQEGETPPEFGVPKSQPGQALEQLKKEAGSLREKGS